MKINVRLLIITFVVIAILSFSSTLIYYSTTTSLLKNQHTKTLINAKMDFNFAFQNLVSNLDSELYELTAKTNITPNKLNELDFIFEVDEDKRIVKESFIYSDKIIISLPTISLDEFLNQYPNIILKFFQNNEYQAYFYGKIIDEELLNNFSEKIRADIALVVNKLPYTTSHKIQNEIYTHSLIEMLKENKINSVDLFYKEFESGDFLANSYTPEFLLFSTDPIEFIVFNIHTDIAEFRDKMQTITIIIALSGALLSLIFILLFTTKIRKQISLLSEAAKVISDGDLSHRVPIISKDELGKLGIVFNNMLENIQDKENLEREYSELITIINKTPQLKQLTDAVLEKIIVATNISFGVFYLVEKNNAKPISTYGINLSTLDIHNSNTFYSDVINNKKTVELNFDENSPVIKTGLAEIKIKYLLIMPVVFNSSALGIIELACEHIPQKSPVEYLNKVREQLAVALNSALSYEQLENLVNELKLLNEQYQNQNVQISEQNSELINLHKELKKQADELEVQRKSAVELSHVKSQFLANMSHELRTPLNSILGLTELIAEDSSTFPKTKDRLKVVYRNGKKLLAMINNILEFSKIESGKYEVTKSNFVLSEFLNDIFNSMEPLITEKGLNFEILFKEKYDLLINSDRHKLEQILLNLLSNAIKFTEVGGIKIILEIDNISLRINIVDSGIGISDEDQIRIFDEFEQVDYTSSRKYQGAGLGLAICKKYIELIGGKIEVISNLIGGSTFTVQLNNAILEKFSVNKSLELKNSLANSYEDNKRIIILQNEENNNEMLNYFGKNNYDVIESKISDTVINELINTSLDGIILIQNTIKKENWELINKLKENSTSKEIPIFILSPNNSDQMFFHPFIVDIAANFTDDQYLNRLIERISIQYKPVKSVLIFSNSEQEIRKELLDVNKSLLVSSSNNENIEFDRELNNIDFLIIDATLLNEDILLQSDKWKIPILIYLPKEQLNDDINLIETIWQKVSLKMNKPNEEVFQIVDRQISQIKNIKKSFTTVIEKGDEKITRVKNKSQFNVMVVDDDSDTQFTVGEILQNIGCEITFANNGIECLTLLKDNMPDLILLDIMMPVMDGFETIRKIRANMKTQNILVYAITAQAMLDDISIIKNSGFDDLITKPVNASTLSFKIQQAIQKRV